MLIECRLPRSLVVAATLVLYSFTTQCVAAHGGGGHGGGGHGGGGHRGGEHRGGEHHGEHNHHPFHPSRHHAGHHDDHHRVAHHNHHHNDWHHGGWGPGYWGGAGLAYGGWGGWGYGGGDTVVDNVTNVTPVNNDSSGDSVTDASNNNDDGDDEDNSNGGNDRGFATDNWPELGIATYAGEYGASQGQVITKVIPGSAAEKAGLVSGDVILSFNGQPVPSADDLDTAMDAARGKFEVAVWDARTGRKSTLSGALDPGIVTPAATKAAVLAPAK